MRRLTIAITLIALTGCTQWVRDPNAGPGDLVSDKARCELMARGMPHDGFAFAGGGSGSSGAYAASAAQFGFAMASLAKAIQISADEHNCMILNGWRVKS